MPFIELKNDGVSKDVPEGTKVVELCEELGSSWPFGCRAGMCGTCLSTVIEGLEQLPPPTDDERVALEGFGAEPNQRLACQLEINSGRVVLEYEN